MGSTTLRNKLSIVELIIDVIITYVSGQVWYYSLFFMTIGDTSILQSNLILLGIQVVLFVINLIITIKWDKNLKNVIFTMLVGYTVYTYLVYAKYMPKVFWGCGIGAGVAIILYGMYVYCRKIPSQCIPKKVHKLRTRRFYVGIKDIVAVTGIVLMIVVCVQKFMVGALMASSPDVQNVEVDEAEEYFLDNIDMLLKLEQEDWDKLDNQEKINILQAVVNYEAMTLGLEPNIVLYSSRLEKGVNGYCIYKDRVIYIDIDHLSDSSHEKVYQTVVHEIFHAAQGQYKDIYENLDESQKKLYFLRRAEQYSQEWDNYKSSSEDGYMEYYIQEMESDARAYSIMAWYRMKTRLELYIYNEKKDGGNTKATETAKERSIDDVTVLKEPLVKKETYHYSSDNIYCSEYSYDSKNRYDIIETFKVDPLTLEKTLSHRDTYSYDDNYYYIESYYPEKNIILEYMYDVYNNPIQSQHVMGQEVVTDAYQYQYLWDTNERREVIVLSKFAGQKEIEDSHFWSQFNEHGDIVYMIEQVQSMVCATVWEYEYDSENRIVRMYEEDWDTLVSDIDTQETVYSYDENGKIIMEIETYIGGANQPEAKWKRQTTTTNEYDEQGRLVKSKIENCREGLDTTITTIEYEYDEEIISKL